MEAKCGAIQAEIDAVLQPLHDQMLQSQAMIPFNGPRALSKIGSGVVGFAKGAATAASAGLQLAINDPELRKASMGALVDSSVSAVGAVGGPVALVVASALAPGAKDVANAYMDGKNVAAALVGSSAEFVANHLAMTITPDGSQQKDVEAEILKLLKVCKTSLETGEVGVIANTP